MSARARHRLKASVTEHPRGEGDVPGLSKRQAMSGMPLAKLSAVFHNYGDVFSGQAARLISLALSLDNRSARSTRVNVH